MSTTSPGPPFSVERLLADSAWLRALALSLVRDPHAAEDLVQETWLRALDRPPRDGASHAGWLATVLRNLARDRARRSARRAARESAAAARRDPPGDTADLVATADAHRALLAEVVRLREPYRETVLLRFFEGLTPAEIAARIGVPPATARSRLHRGLVSLRDALERRDPRGWTAALAPVLATGRRAAPAVARTTGGVIAMTTKSKATVVALVLLLLLGGSAAWLAGTWTGGAARETAATRGDAHAPERGRRRVTTAAAEEPAAASTAGSAPPATDPSAAAPRPRRVLTATVVRRTPVRRAADAADADASDGGGEVGAGDGDGAMVVTEGPVWLEPPPRGDVTLRGRVVDAAGLPLRGARLLRVHTHPDGAPVLRSGWVRFDLLGDTDADGRFDLPDQPSGRWVIQADFHQLRRATGRLSLEGSRTLDLRPGEVREGLRFELPVDSARLGDAAIRLVGPDGRPVAGETVALGSRSAFADADGRVRFDGMEPGEHGLRAHPAGMEPVASTVRIEPGRTQEVELRCAYAVEGALALSGRVIDDSGAPVAGASVFLGNDACSSRSQRTGADGRFSFERLPESMGEGPVVLWVYGDFQGRSHGSARRELTLPVAQVEVVVPRKVEVLVRLRSVGTGAPVPFHRIAVKRRVVEDGRETWDVGHGASGHEESGDVRVHVPAGRIRLSIETKDHDGVEIDLDVPDTDAPYETTVELTPTG